MGKDIKFTFDFSVDAWIRGLEIEAENYEAALEELKSMSLEQIIGTGEVKDFDISNIDVDYDEPEDEDVEIKEISRDDLISEYGWDESQLTVDGHGVVKGYTAVNKYDDESAYIGLQLDDDSYYVVGLRFDDFVDSYDAMADVLKDGF